MRIGHDAPECAVTMTEIRNSAAQQLLTPMLSPTKQTYGTVVYATVATPVEMMFIPSAIFRDSILSCRVTNANRSQDIRWNTTVD